MLFYVQSLWDSTRPEYSDLRKSNGKAHTDYIREFNDQIIVRGPTIDRDGEPDSSIMIADFEDEAALMKFLNEEPYKKCGLIHSFVIRPFEKRFPSLAPSPTSAVTSNQPSTRGVDHLALVTDDMAATVDFYCNVLGMQLVHARRVPFAPDRGQPPYDNVRHYFFNMGNDSLLAFFEYPKDAPKGNRDSLGAMQHVAFHVRFKKFEETLESVRAAGVDVVGPFHLGDDFLSGYFTDNNGIRLEYCTRMGEDPRVVESSAQTREVARAELATLYANSEKVEEVLETMPLRD